MAIGIVAAAAGMMAAWGILQGMLYSYPPYTVARARATFQKNPNMLPPLENLVEMLYKGAIDSGTYAQLSKEIGFDGIISRGVYDSAKQLLDAGDYITLWRRGKLSESDLTKRLKMLHLDDKTITEAQKVSEYFPPAPDLIRFAVREVYTPATVAKFGQKEDLPAQFLEEAKKIGIQEDQATNYWASHWELPSPLQGFEMLHRGVVDEETLSMLLKALDVMPFWRDKLVQIAYKPFTRVDVRRMHAMGILDEDGTYTAYKDLGFDEDKAEAMLSFTKAYNADTSTGLSRANVSKAYKLDLITDVELKTYLEGFGYEPDVVDFWVSMIEYEKTIQVIQAEKSELFKQYSVGAITKDTLRAELGYRDLPSSFIDSAIREVEKTPTLKLKMPSRTDLEAWLKRNIIDEGYYAGQMRELGYRQFDVENYLTEIALEVDTAVRKYMPIKTYQRWFTAGVLFEDDFRRIAGDMKISESDIERLLIEARPE